MQAERREHVLPPRNDIRRPSIHFKSAADHRSQHTGGSQPARRFIVDEGPLRYLCDCNGGQAAHMCRQRHAEARAAAATRQRWAMGGAHRPHGSFLTRRPIHGKMGKTFAFSFHEYAVVILPHVVVF